MGGSRDKGRGENVHRAGELDSAPCRRVEDEGCREGRHRGRRWVTRV